MYRFPAESIATPHGSPNCALVAGPPSPEYPDWPFPATVLMTPLGETFRTRLFMESAMYKLPDASTATLCGENNCALVAGPPSPEKPPMVVPATVEITPFETFRTRLVVASAMNRFPAESTATP